MTVRPYGTWPSELGSGTVSRETASRFAVVDVRDGRVRWCESRAAEGGRAVVVEWEDGRVSDVTPAATSARTRVHEYGGGAVWLHGETAFCSEFADSRPYRAEAGAATPADRRAVRHHSGSL